MVTIEYRIDPAETRHFLAAAEEELSHGRRREGALSRFEDTAEPGRWLEWFLVESWVEHLRQRGRVTHADSIRAERVQSFHGGDAPPRVAHLLAPNPS